MDWILFFLTPSDNVRYIMSNMQQPTFMSYPKFIKFIVQFTPVDYHGLLKQINKYQTILLSCETGEWVIQKPEWTEDDLSYDNLKKLNQDKLKISDRKKEMEQKRKGDFRTGIWRSTKEFFGKLFIRKDIK